MTPPTPTPTPSSRSSSDGASVLQQHRLCGGDRLVVLLRGTSSAFEWTYNLNYTMGPDASYGLGQIHTGFHTVAEEVWGAGLQALLMQEVGQAGGVSNIIFSGHSLGGAVAALLAAKTQVGVHCTCAAGISHKCGRISDMCHLLGLLTSYCC
jgi:pimeloyl-ACP methyl ester carboxylesterase